MSSPEFSVIIPTLNRAALVLGAVESAVAQDGVSLEVVVVDDGSTDATAEILAGADLPAMRFVQRATGGISAARNSGAAEARGRWLVFLDDDDRLLPGHLATFREVLLHERVVAATCGVRLVDPDGRLLAEQLPARLGPAFDSVVARFVAGALAVEAKAFHGAGGYLEGLQCSHQTEFAFRLLDWCEANGAVLESIPEVLVEILRPRPEQRSEASPTKLLSGSEAVLARHAGRFRRDRPMRADFHAVAGVAAARLGRFGVARRHLFAALRATPLDPRAAARAMLALVPGVARRVWQADRYIESDPVAHLPNGSGSSLE